MLSVIMLIVITLSVIMLNVIMLNVIMQYYDFGKNLLSVSLPAPLSTTTQASLGASPSVRNDLSNNPLFMKCLNKNQF
jgi:hypothetical protein